MTLKLVVGLQNPGKAYENTRHNVGAWFVHALVKALGATLHAHKTFHGDVASVPLNEQTVHLLLPTTWMNQSGRAVRALCQFYHIHPEQVLVVHDDLDLPVGDVRLKSGGGHGGHNGLRDLLAHADGRMFQRLRFGIGHPGHKDLVTDYVLGKPSQAEKQEINHAIERAIRLMPDVLAGRIEKVMMALNTKEKE